MDETGRILQTYIKASNDRPYRDRPGVLNAPGMDLLTLGTILEGPAPVRTVRDGEGRRRRVYALYEAFGAAQWGTAKGYLVETERGRGVWLLGGQLGLLFGGEPRPIMWVECPGEDLAQEARKALLSDVALCQRCGRILAESDSPYWNDGGEVFLCDKCAEDSTLVEVGQ